MFDKVLLNEILSLIIRSTKTVFKRFEPINSVSDFTDSPVGVEKLDSICMQLITIGEGLKNIDKITNQKLLVNYPEIDWKGAKAMRDIISHHYFEIDAEIIFDVCKNKIPILVITLKKIQEDIKKKEIL